MEERELRNWVLFCHLGGILPCYFFNLLIPLIIWLAKRKDATFMDDQGREIVNFQLSLFIYESALTLLALTIIGIPITIAGYLIVYMINVISIIRGALKASKGEFFTYPINLRLIN